MMVTGHGTEINIFPGPIMEDHAKGNVFDLNCLGVEVGGDKQHQQGVGLAVVVELRRQRGHPSCCVRRAAAAAAAALDDEGLVLMFKRRWIADFVIQLPVHGGHGAVMQQGTDTIGILRQRISPVKAVDAVGPLPPPVGKDTTQHFDGGPVVPLGRVMFIRTAVKLDV